MTRAPQKTREELASNSISGDPWMVADDVIHRPPNRAAGIRWLRDTTICGVEYLAKVTVEKRRADCPGDNCYIHSLFFDYFFRYCSVGGDQVKCRHMEILSVSRVGWRFAWMDKCL